MSVEPPSVTEARVLTFEIPGTPAAWARARTGKGRFFKSAKQERAQASVEGAYVEAAQGLQPHEGPVQVAIACHFLAPKDHWEGRECTKRPDLDNLAKLVGDALNGLAYRDDSQIVGLTVEKHYTTGHERTEVTLTFKPSTPKPRKSKADVKLGRELAGGLRG